MTLSGLILALAGVLRAADERHMMQTVLERYRTVMLQEDFPLPHWERYSVASLLPPGATKTEIIRKYLHTQTPEGAWPDVDYKDGRVTGWKPYLHLNRLIDMAQYWALAGEPLPLGEKLRRAVSAGVRNWVEHRYRCRNWWYNEIRVPRDMSAIVVIMGDALGDDLRSGAMDVINQHRLRGGGANLTWSAEIAVHYACLTGDKVLLDKAINRIWGGITIDGKAGIQSDGSFYQHGRRLQTYQYGQALIDSVVRIAWQMRETPWAIPPDKRRIISDYLVAGPMWLCRGTTSSPAGVDRAVSRKEWMKIHPDFRHLVRRWIDVDPDARPQMEKYIAWQNGDTRALSGFRYFPRSELAVYHRSDASVFVKMLSSRVLPTESINHENLKGWPYLSCGDHYILRDGNEYADLPPVWRWERLPGLTLGREPSYAQSRGCVGGLGDGKSGLSVMEYARCEKREPRRGGRVKGVNKVLLSVRKMWAFHDDMVACLMSGWKMADGIGDITTSLEQCALRGDVRVGCAGSATASQTLEKGVHNLTDACWVLHHGIGYMPLGNSHMRVMLQEQKGSWHDINNNKYDPDDRGSKAVSSVLLDHGHRPAPCGFVLVLAADAEKLNTMSKRPPWKILYNDGTCQCIRFADGTTMAAFYGPGSIGDLKVDKPSLALWNGETRRVIDLPVSGPAQK